MPRKSVNVTFVGATDVVEHVVSSTQNRRRTLASASDIRVDEDVVIIEEDCLQQKMSEELLDDQPSPLKSIKKSTKSHSLVKEAVFDQISLEEEKRPRRSCVTPSKLTLNKTKTPLKAIPLHLASSRTNTPTKSTPNKTHTPSKPTSSRTNTPSKPTPSRTNTPRQTVNRNTTPHPTSKSGKKSLNTTKVEDSESSSDSSIEFEEEDEERELRLRINDDEEEDHDWKKQVAEDFFDKRQKLKKGSSSNKQIDRLPLHEINMMLKKRKLKGTDKLMHYYYSKFRLFFFLLMQDYNILFYGLGSKMKLIAKLQNFLSDYNCIVVNGFFPGLSFKNIISGLLELLGFEPEVPASSMEQVDLVRSACASTGGDVFLLLNNIDGFNLRKAQEQLSLLASIPGLHLVASIDKINAPLLWDQTKLQRFNWLCFETATFESYGAETSSETCLLVRPSEDVQLSSLTHIMRSLTSNSKGIFTIICQHHLDHHQEPLYMGLAFSELYMKSRESFLVNSEPTLRAQLVEFTDHHLIKLKKGGDGVEYVVVNVDQDVITAFLQL